MMIFIFSVYLNIDVDFLVASLVCTFCFAEAIVISSLRRTDYCKASSGAVYWTGGQAVSKYARQFVPSDLNA